MKFRITIDLDVDVEAWAENAQGYIDNVPTEASAIADLIVVDLNEEAPMFLDGDTAWPTVTLENVTTTYEVES